MYLAALPEGAYILWTLRLRQQRGCSRLPRLAPARSPIHSLDHLTLPPTLSLTIVLSLSPLSLTTPSLTAPFLPSSPPHCFLSLSLTLNNQPSLPTSLASSLPHSTTTSLPHHSLTALPRSITPSLTPQLRLFIQSHHSHRLNLTFRIRFALLSIRQFETLIANALYACDSLRRSCSHIITLEVLLFDMRV